MAAWRVIFVGDGGVATGFSRVNEGIINNLPEDKYEIHHLAINYHGDPYEGSKAKLYPALLGGDVYGFGRLPSMIANLNPDLIFILNDLWNHPNYLERIPEEFKVITYFPVDAKPMGQEWCETVIKRSHPVAYTNYGKSAITDHFPDADVRVIPHGINSSIFYPMDMDEARSHLAGIAKDDFLILSANRNQPRKRTDLTIKGFAQFAKGKTNAVKLYLHLGIEDAGWNIVKLCQRYGIDMRLAITSPDLGPGSGVTDQRLNWIYNSCDVGITNSMGEGWGLTGFEHGACRKAQIVMDHSASKELYEGKAYLLPVDHYDTYPGILSEGAVTTPEHIAAAMEYYYENPDKREQDANAIYEFISQPKFQWSEVAKVWDQLFEEVLNE